MVSKQNDNGCTSKFISYITCSGRSPRKAVPNIVGTGENSTGPEQKALDELRRLEWKEAQIFHDELSTGGDYNILGHGPVEDFHRGLEYFLGPPKKLLYEAMEREHCNSSDSDLEFFAANYGVQTTSKIEWNFVIDPSEKKLAELNIEEWPSESKLDPNLRRKPLSLDSFEDDLAEVNDKLQRIGMPRMTLVELIALRIYSGPMGVKFNKMIRSHTAGHRAGQEWRKDEERKLCLGNKYPTTIHVIQSAISKLGKINPSEVGYSGVSGMLLAAHFWEDHPDLNSKGGVEGGFMSLSKNRDVGKHYAGLQGGRLGVLLEVDMSTMDRGAELSWLAQYPHEEETLLPPLTFLHVEHIRLDSTSKDTLMIVETRVRISQSIRIQMPLLTDQENNAIHHVLKENKDQNVMTNSKLLSRFSDEERFFISGNPTDSVSGLSHLLGVDDLALQSAKLKGLKELEREILASGEEEVIRNMNYVLHQTASECELSNGIRDIGNEGKRLADFVNHPTSKQYHLREEHVAALRIYTTSAFSHINNPLRGNNQNDQKEKIPHPFPVTVSLIDDAIKLLRASTADTFKEDSHPDDLDNDFFLWRGIKNTRITEEFLQGRKGGTGEF